MLWSRKYIEYVIVKDADINAYMNVDLGGYRWRNDDGVHLCRRKLDWK